LTVAIHTERNKYGVIVRGQRKVRLQ
jgi:hypothetical protein